MESIDLNDVCLIEDNEILYILYHDWVFIYFFLFSQLILLFKIILIWFIVLKILGYCVNAVNTKADPLMLQEHYEAHKTEYPLIYRIRKSKIFHYMSEKGSKIRQSKIFHYMSEKGSKIRQSKIFHYMSEKGSKIRQSKIFHYVSEKGSKIRKKYSHKLFRYRGGRLNISQIVKIPFDFHYNKIGQMKSIKTQLQVLIYDKVLVKVFANLGILSFGTIGNLVPRIIGIVINANVIFKPIDDGKLLVQFYSTASFIERIEKVQIKRPPEISPKQILFVPGPRNSNQVTIITLGSKFKLMCSLRENVDFEKTSQPSFVPLVQRTTTFQDIIRDDDIIQADDTEIQQNNDIFLHRVKAEKLNDFNE